MIYQRHAKNHEKVAKMGVYALKKTGDKKNCELIVI